MTDPERWFEIAFIFCFIVFLVSAVGIGQSSHEQFFKAVFTLSTMTIGFLGISSVYAEKRGWI